MQTMPVIQGGYLEAGCTIPDILFATNAVGTDPYQLYYRASRR